MIQVTDQDYENYLQYIYDGLSADEINKLEAASTDTSEPNCVWVPTYCVSHQWLCLNKKSEGVKKFVKNK